ncbi:MAG: hypothetical protein Q9173_003851 [Seirophora scorigena]
MNEYACVCRHAAVNTCGAVRRKKEPCFLHSLPFSATETFGLTASIHTSTSHSSPLGSEPDAGTHETPARVLDTIPSRTCDIESQSTTDSNLSSATFDEGTGVRRALNRIQKALHIRRTDETKNKIRPDLNPDFLIYRKFGWLRNRLSLNLQDELVTLEQELQLLGNNEARLCDPEDVLISRGNDELQKTLRQELLPTIRQKLLEYGGNHTISVAALQLMVICR